MGSVFKRAGRRKWYFKVQLPDGTWSSPRVGFVDKRATEQKQATEQAKIDRGEVGLVDPFDETRGTSFLSLVSEFADALRLKGRSERYVGDTMKRLTLFAESMQIRNLPDATIAKVNEFLGRLLQARGLRPQKKLDKDGCPVPRRPVSLRTRDAYVEAFWVFGAWLEKAERWRVHPFPPSKLERVARECDRRHPRRAFTADEIELVAQAAESRGAQEYLRTHPEAGEARLAEISSLGWARGVSYRLAGWAALRYESEVAALRWSDLVLDGAQPHVVIRAAHQKERRTDKVPLVGFVVEWLLEHLRRETTRRGGKRPDGEGKVFSIGRNHLATLRKDVRFAGIGERDSQGRVAGSHSFRKGTCRMLALAGVPMAVTQKIVRHQDPKTTLNVYAEIEALRDGLRELNRISGSVVAPNVAPNLGPMGASADRSGPEAQVACSEAVPSHLPEDEQLASIQSVSGRSRPPDGDAEEVVGRTGFEPVTSTL